MILPYLFLLGFTLRQTKLRSDCNLFLALGVDLAILILLYLI